MSGDIRSMATAKGGRYVFRKRLYARVLGKARCGGTRYQKKKMEGKGDNLLCDLSFIFFLDIFFLSLIVA